MPVKKGKGTSDYMPVRKPPAGVKMPTAKKAAAKPAPKSGPMRRPTMADRIQDAKNVQPKGPAKPKTTKAKQPVGPAAVIAIQDRTSPAGVKKAEMDAKKAIDKKYPGLYKKSK
jgi:hypothetical protein